MEERIAQRIRGLADWDQLKNFEDNALSAGRLTADVVAALAQRSTELGLAFIAEKTGVDVTNLSPAKKRIAQAVGEVIPP